jgi:formylglycine-generating enzyme
MAAESLPAMASIPAGTFVMGSEDGAADERPTHTVVVGGFALGVQPVTNAEYARFVRETGYRPPAIDNLPLVARAGGEAREHIFRTSAATYVWKGGQPPSARLNHPVTLVRWEDAVSYCRWLSQTIGKTVRLPTEAEWERAARGGLSGLRYPWGDELRPDHANFLSEPGIRTTHGTSTCRSYPPNAYGLFDMSGNVWEWVLDWYDPGYYAVSPEADPSGPEDGQYRIVRGGGWLAADPTMLTCSHRHQVPPDTYSYGIGFRVACPE